jgi:tetratricopeptide (TPR) repeat protein
MIERNVLLAGFLVLCCGWTHAQAPPPAASGPGERLRAEGDIPGAIAEFTRAYGQNPRNAENVYGLARVLSINRNLDKCFEYLDIAVALEPSLAPLIDPDLVTARQDQRWPAFEDKVAGMLIATSRLTIQDVEYAKVLWKLRAWDQAYFAEVGIAGRKVGMKSSVVEALWAFKFMIQERSQAELERLVAAKGWPRVRAVGSEAAMAAYLVAMHSKDGAQKRYLADIKKACEAKELPWIRYALIFDRALFNENKPQRFGTHTRYNELTGKEELYPLEDEALVDEWRKELGLEPLEEYLKQFKIIYTPKK